MINAAIKEQNFTCAALNASGYVAAGTSTGAAFTQAATTAGDGLGHPVTITNLTANTHVGQNFTVTGTDANDNALSETIAGPGGNATVTTTKYFKTVTSIVPSASLGADTFNIGWTAVGVSAWVKVNYNQSNFNVSAGAVLRSGVANWDVEHTMDTAALDGNIVDVFKHGVLVGQTGNAWNTFNAPTHGVRMKVNSHTAGVLAFYVGQGEMS